jgi:hypothetical protein
MHAFKSGVSPEDLPKWLKKGGGVAGRAAQLTNMSGTKKETAKKARDMDNASVPQPSPEANHLVARFNQFERN